jgi:Zn-dependent M16 (insulinase) family peptidase
MNAIFLNYHATDQKGYTSFVQHLTGESAADRQKWRDQVLGTNPADFKDFAEKLRKIKSDGSVVVFGSQAALDAASAELGENKLIVEQAFGSKAK